jgi:tetratricopeptide (TPR) repeat protein
MKDFFISYSRVDRPWAEWIAWQLEDAGYTTFLQYGDAPDGPAASRLPSVSAEAERTIAVLSPAYQQAIYTQQEWSEAFDRDPSGEKGKLLPVRVEDFMPHGPLSTRIYIDLVGRDEDAARAALLEGVRRERSKPSSMPVFPGLTHRSATNRPRFPSALPPVWNVPYRRNPHFVGREDLINDLRASVRVGRSAALVGLAGMGKSQLAVEYSYRYRSDYSLVWWIQAENPDVAAGAFTALARALDLPEKAQLDKDTVIAAVRRWLESADRWLLIFDHAESPEDIRPLLFPKRGGHVIITSRNPSWERDIIPIAVEGLDRDSAVRFLLNRTNQADFHAAEAIAKQLGYLPLALEQAGAYIAETVTPLSEYFGLLQTGRTHDPEPINSVLQLSSEKVEEASPLAAELLRLFSFLAPDDLPLDLLYNPKVHLGEPLRGTLEDSFAITDAIGALQRHSLVMISGGTIAIHRLVQKAIREGLDQEQREVWASAAIQLIQPAFRPDGADTRISEQAERLLPHALAVIDHGLDLMVELTRTSALLNQVAGYFWSHGETSEAKASLETALNTTQAVFGEEHPNVAVTLNNLGLVLRGLGELETAKAVYQRALELAESHYGENSPNVAVALSNLGLVLRELGELQAARTHSERALEIDRSSLGPGHPRVAEDLGILGGVLYELGDIVSAKAVYASALDITTTALGPDHPATALRLVDLGSVFQELGDLEEARTHYERALVIHESAYGPEHAQVASDFNHLGSVSQELGRLEEARTHYERALVIHESAYGPEHAQVASDLNHLGSVSQELGNLSEAKANYERALEILGSAHGSALLSKAWTLSNLASVLRSRGDLERARACYEEALGILEVTSGPEQRRIAAALTGLGSVLHDLGDLAGARAAQERALGIYEALDDPRDKNIALVLSGLGEVLRELGDLAAAKATYQRALSMGDAYKQPGGPDLAYDLNNFGNVLRELGDLGAAKANLERALQVSEAAYGQDHPKVASILGSLGGVLRELGDTGAANAHYERALAIYEKTIG